jgi:hypothetical protein
MTNVSEHNITVEECPVIPPVEVAGGGGGGSGCLTSWDCSGWSECANGKQSRTCAKEESGCNAGAKPVETMSCAMEEAEPLFSPEEVPAPTSNILLIVIWSIIGAGVIGGIIWYIIYKKKKKAATSLAAYNIQ